MTLATKAARRGDWIETYTGKRYWPLDPRAEDISLEDIAHSLSLQCRYTGHCREFYSVAEHTVRVSRLIEQHLRYELSQFVSFDEELVRIPSLCGLHHDDSETWLIDLPRPLKRYGELGRLYKLHEEENMKCVAERYGLPWPMPEIVKWADDTLLATEKRDLMMPSDSWGGLPEPLPEIIIPWTSRDAELAYRERHSQLIRI